MGRFAMSRRRDRHQWEFISDVQQSFAIGSTPPGYCNTSLGALFSRLDVPAGSLDCGYGLKKEKLLLPSTFSCANNDRASVFLLLQQQIVDRQ